MSAAIETAPHEAVVGASPQQLFIKWRRADRIDDAAARASVFVVGDGRSIKRCRQAWVFPGEIRADHVPVAAVVTRSEDPLVAEVEGAATGLSEHQRLRPLTAIQIGVSEGGVDTLRQPRAQVDTIHPSPEEHLRIVRVGRNVVALATRRGLAEMRQVDAIDVVGAARNAGGP